MSPKSVSATPDMDKTREQLLAELRELRARNALLEQRGSGAEPPDVDLRNNESMTRLLLEQKLYGLWVNVGGRIAYINEIGAKILGASNPAEVIGKSVLDEVIHPDYRDIVKGRIKAMSGDDSAVPLIEEKFIQIDGSVVDVDVWAISFIYRGKPAILVAFKDISKRKRAEEALKLTQLAMDNFGESAIWVAKDGRLAYVNRAACRSLGYSSEELLSMHIWDIDPNYSPETIWELWQVRMRDHHTKFESTHVARDGRVFPVDVTSCYTRYGDEEYVVTFDRDVTERKQAEKILQESEEKFRALAEHSPAIVFFHQGGKHRYVNPAAEAITGYSQAELLDMDFWMLVAPEYRDEVKARGLARLRGENPDSRYPVRILTKQGMEKWLEVWTAMMEYEGRPAVMVTALDVTERKRAERALKSSEEKYRELVENANSIIIRWDTHGNLTFFNEYAEKLFGYTEDEVLGRNVVGTIVSPSESTGRDLAALMADVERYPERYELNVNENMRKNGERVWIAWTNKAIRDKLGNLVEILSVGNDITERKRAEEALWDSQAHLSSVFRAAPTGIGVVVDRVITEANDRLCEMTGYTREELLGKSARIFYRTEEDYEYVGREKYARIEQLGTGTVETKWRRKDGSMIDILLSSTPLEPGDLHVGVTFTALDITERKQAEKALIRERFILTKSQEIAHVGNWSLDLRAGVCTGSIENYRIYGYEPGEVKLTLEWILSRSHPEDRPEVADFMEANVRDGKLGSIDFRIIRPDGSVRYVNTIVDKAVRDKAGRITRLYGISQDVTERKRAEEELKAAKQQAELYLDLMGHDINNMHQVALGYLELAGDLHAGADQAVYMDKSAEVLQRSTKLIQNVRKLQKLHEGVLPATDVDVGKLLTDIKSEYGAVPGKTISLNMNGHDHCIVHANELLHDVFANLVNNAIKHTGEGAKITVDLDLVCDDGGRFCRVVVEDNGPGIQDDSKDKIFNRMHKGTARGMGLGLYLVKTLVDSYGGKVWVEDRVKGDHTQGARFVVMLPVAG